MTISFQHIFINQFFFWQALGRALALCCLFLQIGQAQNILSHSFYSNSISGEIKKHFSLIKSFKPSDPQLFYTLNPNNTSALRISIPIGANPFTIRACANATIKLEAQASGNGNLQYEWINLSNGSIIGTTQTINIPFIEGQFRVKITDNDDNTLSSTVIQLCADNQPPTNVKIKSTPSKSFCINGSPNVISLEAEANGSSGSLCNSSVFTYQWFKDNVAIQGAVNQTLNINNAPDATGFYTVRVFNACGFSAQSTATEEVKFVEATPFDLKIYSEDGTNFICLGGSLKLNLDLVGAFDLVEWFLENNNTPIGQGQSIVVNQAGRYKVKARNGCGTSESNFFQVDLTSRPTGVSIFSNLFNSTVCSSELVELSPGLEFGGPATRYEWYKDNSLVAAFDFPFLAGKTYYATESGSYILKSLNKCGEVSSAVYDLQIMPFADEIQIIPDGNPSLSSICVPPTTSVKLLTQTIATDLIYQWYRNGVPLPDGVDAEYIATAPGLYTVEAFGQICGSFLTDDFEVIANDNTLNGAIVLNSSGILNSCTGKIDLTCTNFGLGVSYEWYQDNQKIATTALPAFKATIGGVYTVKAKNACSQTSFSNPLTLSILQTPNTPLITAPFGVSTCQITLLTLKVSNPQNNMSYQWYKNGASIPNATNTSFEASESGTYEVKVFNGCAERTSSSIELKFLVKPQFDNVKISFNPCDIPLRLSVNTPANFLIYQWYRIVGNNSTLLSTQATFQPTQSGTYVVKVRNACLATNLWISSPPVNINLSGGVALPLPEITSNNDRFCPGDSLLLQVNNVIGSNFGFRWFKGNQLIPNADEQTIYVKEANLYSVEVFALNNSNCSKLSLPYGVFQYSTPTLLLTLAGQPIFCEGDSLRLNVNTQIPPLEFKWFKDNELVGNGNSIAAKTAGEYRVEAVYSANILGFPCDFVAKSEVNLNTKPQPFPVIFKEGELLKVEDNYPKYEWNFNGTPILTANQPTYLPLDSGRYTVTVTNDIGCRGTSEFVYSKGIYLGFNPTLKITPNPNLGKFFVTIVSQNVSIVQLFDTMGQEVLPSTPITKQNSLAGQFTYEYDNLSPGVYILKTLADGKAVTKKVVVW
jgi:hypothetical protein